MSSFKPSSGATARTDHSAVTGRGTMTHAEIERRLLQLGTTGTGGTDPSGAPLAPNVVSANCFITYDLASHNTKPVFGGTMALASDVSALAVIEVYALSPANEQYLITRITDGFTNGGALDYSGSNDDVIQKDIIQLGWALVFLCFNAEFVPTPDPTTIPVTISKAGITSLSGFDSFADRWMNTDRSLFAVLSVSIACTNYPQVYSLWHEDVDGNHLHGWYTAGASETFKIGLKNAKEIIYAPSADGNWKLKAALGTWEGNDTAGWRCADLKLGPMPLANIPGLKVSFPFAVAKMNKPAATTLPSDAVTYTTPGAGNWPYNHVIDDSGAQDYLIPQIAVDESAARADTGASFIILTAQDFDSAGNAIGPESKYGVISVNHTGDVVRVWGALEGQYANLGYGYDRVNPYPGGSPANLAKVGLRHYLVSRLDDGDASWKNAACSTLQTHIGTNGLLMITVAEGGTLPPGKISAIRIDPATLGSGFTTDFTGKPSIAYGSGLADDGTGKVALKYGSFLADDGTGAVTVKIAGPLFKDVSGQLNMKTSSDLVVVAGVLTQAFVNLANAYNFDVGEFSKTTGVLKIGAIAVNKLAAGTAFFSGVATFANSATGPYVQIGAAGAVLADNFSSPTSTVTATSTGVTVAKGGNRVEITGSLVGIYGPSGSLTATSGGIAITNGSSSVTVSASAVTIINGTFTSPSISGGSLSLTSASGSVSVNAFTQGVECKSGNLLGNYYAGALVLANGTTMAIMNANGIFAVTGSFSGTVTCAALSVSGSVNLSGTFSGTHSGFWSGTLSPQGVSCPSYTITCWALTVGPGGISYNGVYGLTTGALAFLKPDYSIGFLRWTSGGLVASSNF